MKMDLALAEGNCEYQRQKDNFEEGSIPAMMYIDTDGNVVDISETLQDKEQLRAKLDKLLE